MILREKYKNLKSDYIIESIEELEINTTRANWKFKNCIKPLSKISFHLLFVYPSTLDYFTLVSRLAISVA
jgi:hypothetical protein